MKHQSQEADNAEKYHAEQGSSENKNKKRKLTTKAQLIIYNPWQNPRSSRNNTRAKKRIPEETIPEGRKQRQEQVKKAKLKLQERDPKQMEPTEQKNQQTKKNDKEDAEAYMELFSEIPKRDLEPMRSGKRGKWGRKW